MPAPYAEPSFESLRLSPETLQALREMGFYRPTPVQAATYTPIVEGRDLIIQAQPGSGKVSAYGVPLAEMLNPLDKRVQALILVPSRELANQAAEELVRIFSHRELSVAAVYGGAAMGGQIAELKSGAQIVVGTPDRVYDLLQRNTLRLEGLRILILDETEELLSGFAKALNSILELAPKERQSLIFSPSLSQNVLDLGRRFLSNPVEISIADLRAETRTTHEYYLVSGVGKHRDLVRLIRFLEVEQGVIFCNTFEDIHFLNSYFKRKGISAAELTQDLSPNEREKVLQKLKQKEIRFLIANTTAAQWLRGAGIVWAVNYSIPESPEDYPQRANYIGHARQGGTVISLVSPQDLGNFITIRKVYKLGFQEKTLPSEAELKERDTQRRFQALSETLSRQSYTPEQEALAQYLLVDPRGPQLIAALLARLEAKPAAPAPTPAKAAARPAEPAPTQPEPPSPPPPPTLPAAPGESWEDVPLLKLSSAPLRAKGAKPRPTLKAPTPENPGEKEKAPASASAPAVAREKGATPKPSHSRPSRPAPAPAPEAAVPPVKEDAAPEPVTPLPPTTAVPTPSEPAPKATVESKEALENGALPHSTLEAAPPSEALQAPREEPPAAPEQDAQLRAEPPAAPAPTQPEPVEEAAAPPQDAPANEEPSSAPSAEAAPLSQESAPQDAGEAEATENGEFSAEGEEESEGVRMTRLYLNLGRRDDLRASEVTRFLREHIKLSRRDLGRVQVRDTYSHIGVRAELAEEVIKAISGQKFKDKEIVVEIARGKD